MKEITVCRVILFLLATQWVNSLQIYLGNPKDNGDECLVEGDIISPCRDKCRDDEKHVMEEDPKKCVDPARPKCCALKVELRDKKKAKNLRKKGGNQKDDKKTAS